MLEDTKKQSETVNRAMTGNIYNDQQKKKKEKKDMHRSTKYYIECDKKLKT